MNKGASERVFEIAALRDQSWTLRAISREMGVSPQRICQICKSHGIVKPVIVKPTPKRRTVRPAPQKPPALERPPLKNTKGAVRRREYIARLKATEEGVAKLRESNRRGQRQYVKKMKATEEGRAKLRAKAERNYELARWRRSQHKGAAA